MQLENKDTIKRTQQQLIPPGSPHFVRFWEAGIKSTKGYLRKFVGEQIHTHEEMATLLTQMENCLNSRPLYACSNDGNDLDLYSEPEITASTKGNWTLLQSLKHSF